jgi:hypothetical protein
VSGFVEVRTDEDVTCNGLTVELRWQTHGKGNNVHGESLPRELFRGEWTAGAVNRYPFSFQLPYGPFTYHGHYLNVGWFVRTRADIPWAIDAKAEREVAVHPDQDADAEPRWNELLASPTLLPGELRAEVLGERLPAGPQPTALKVMGRILSMGCLLVFAVPVLVLAGFGIAKGVGLARGEVPLDEGLIWIGLTVVMLFVFLGGAVKTIRNRIARSKLGDVRFDVTPLKGRRGEALRARLVCQPKKAAELTGAKVRLEAQEVVVRGSGTNRRTYRHTVYEDETELPAARTLAAGMPFQLDHQVVIPDDAPPSFMAQDNRLAWTLSIHLDIARWPDWSEGRAILVHP